MSALLSKVNWLVATACLAVALCGGCERPTPTEYQPRGVELRTASEQDLEQAIAAYRGNVVLVDFWATWCDPCRRLFPHTVSLQRELGPKGLRVITVSLDVPDNEPQVRRFLDDHGAVTENLLSCYDGIAESTQRFDLPGAIPYLRIYDRSGSLRKDLAGAPKSTDSFDRFLRQLLAEK